MAVAMDGSENCTRNGCNGRSHSIKTAVAIGTHCHWRTSLLVCTACAVAIVVSMTSDGFFLPKVITYKETRRYCNMKQQSCVADSGQLSRSSISKVSNGKA